MINKDSDTCKKLFEEQYEKIEDLHNEFKQFTMHCKETSEVCQFWETFHYQKLICVGKDADWEAHLHAVQELMPVF